MGDYYTGGDEDSFIFDFEVYTYAAKRIIEEYPDKKDALLDYIDRRDAKFRKGTIMPEESREILDLDIPMILKAAFPDRTFQPADSMLAVMMLAQTIKQLVDKTSPEP